MDSQLKENVFLPISDQELNRRWSAVRKEMKKQEIDCLVIQNSEAHMGGYVRWFIDIPAKFGTPLTVLFPADDEMTAWMARLPWKRFEKMGIKNLEL